MTAEMETDQEQPLLSHYRLKRELGRGFSSIVYEATDERRPRTVALKVLTFLQTLNEERRTDLAARFGREAQAVSALSHPNIVAIYEVGEAADGRQYIAMECLPGETLRRRLHRASPLSIPEAVAVTIHIADALHYAHGRGIIHRDVKPDNVFLARSTKAEDTPKLMDFGIAHLLSDQGLTLDGTIVGSPAYMSPEQINGLTVDARTDVFSLAVTLTEMVTGTKPFVGETIPAVMQQILRHAPNLSAVADRRLRNVLSKALSKNPAARYSDAADFADALRLIAPQAVSAPSIATQVMPAPHPAGGRRGAQSFPLWGAVVLGGLLLTGLAWPRTATNTPEPGPKPASVSLSPQRPLLISAPVPLAPGAKRREIAAAWHPAARRVVRSASAAPTVQIAEVSPAPQQLSYYARRPHFSSVIQMPKHLPAQNTPAAPARLTVRANSGPPRLSVLLPHAAAHVVSSAVPSATAEPIVRVAADRQELSHIGKTAPVVVSEREPASSPEAALPSLPKPADSPPRPVHCPVPQALADADSPSTAVRLRLSINEEGDVTEATILASSGSRALDDAALDAVGRWGYDPAIRNGHAVSSFVIETIKFSRQ